MRRLLESGAPINFRDYHGETALILAAQFGQTSVVDLLMTSGADPTVMGCFGNALAAAARGYRLETLEYLLKKGMAPNNVTATGDNLTDVLRLKERGKSATASPVKKTGITRDLEPLIGILRLARQFWKGDTAPIDKALAPLELAAQKEFVLARVRAVYPVALGELECS